MTLYTHPEYRTCLWLWSGDQPELTDLIPAERICTEALPAVKVFPLAKITQLADPDIVAGTHAVVRGLFQFDVWGGSPALTWEIAETWRALLIERLTGVNETTAGDFTAGLVTCGGIVRTTDSPMTQAPEGAATAETSRARPRCRFDAQIVLRPATAGSGS